MTTPAAPDERFCGARLRVARSLAGLTQVELADKVKTSSAFLSYMEAGQRELTPVLGAAIADVLDVEVGFFWLPPPREFRDDECFFRRRKSTTMSVRNQVLAHATLFGEMLNYVEEMLSLPEPDLPTVRVKTLEEIERAAERCRLQWGLGLDVPVTSMTRVVENAGVPITRFEGLSDRVDAFSRLGTRHLIVLNDKTPSRTRWDLAHEMGHLVMHCGLHADVEELEDQANRFASAFLLPRSGFAREFPRFTRWSWEPLFRLKERWRASLAAIVRRAFDLRLITALQYRTAYKYMSWKGWLRAEPFEFSAEPPELVSVAFAELKQSFAIGASDMASVLRWRPGTLLRIAGLIVEPEGAPTRRAKVVRLAKPGRKRA